MRLSYQVDLNPRKTISFEILEVESTRPMEYIFTVPSVDYKMSARRMRFAVHRRSKTVWLIKDLGVLGDNDSDRIVVGLKAQVE